MAGLLLRLLLFLLFLAGLFYLITAFLPEKTSAAIILPLAYLPTFLTVSFLFTVFMLFPVGFLLGFNACLLLMAVVPLPAVKLVAVAFLLWLCYGQFTRFFSVGPKKWTQQEIEDAIVWAKVGPEEMPLVEKLRAATASYQINALAKQLASRDVLQMPEETESYTFGDFLDDWRVYAGILLKFNSWSLFYFIAFVTVIFGAVYLSANNLLGLPADIGNFKNSAMLTYSAAMLVIAAGAGIVAGYYGWGMIDTSSWKDLLIGWLILIVCQGAAFVLWLFLLLPLVLPVLEGLSAALGS